MRPLPNPMVPLVDFVGHATPALRGIFETGLPNTMLVDSRGIATAAFREFLATVASPLPAASVALTDNLGRPTRVMTALLMKLP